MVALCCCLIALLFRWVDAVYVVNALLCCRCVVIVLSYGVVLLLVRYVVVLLRLWCRFGDVCVCVAVSCC